MSEVTRVTIYFEPDILRELRAKAGSTGRSVSGLVNCAVRASVSEDAADIAAFEVRATERVVPFERLVSTLKRKAER